MVDQVIKDLEALEKNLEDICLEDMYNDVELLNAKYYVEQATKVYSNYLKTITKEEVKKLNPGDVVMLASGGPHMTVIKLEKDIIKCIWYIDNCSKYEEGSFYSNLLVKV
jgi:uncharacterized protein YodC (DUF2158 family)